MDKHEQAKPLIWVDTSTIGSCDGDPASFSITFPHPHRLHPSPDYSVSAETYHALLHPKPITGHGQTRLVIHDQALLDYQAALRAGAASHHVSEIRPEHCGYCGDALLHMIQLGGGEWCSCQRCPVLWRRLADGTWAEEVY